MSYPVKNANIYRRFIACSILILAAFLIVFTSCSSNEQPILFTFVHATDFHIADQDRGVEGTVFSISKINEMAPEFVIGGGDQIMDAYEVNFEDATANFDLWDQQAKMFNMPIYYVMGNHEVFGFDPKSGISPDHPKYGKELFKERMGNGKVYYSFDYKGWHFIILDSVHLPDSRSEYEGFIGEKQMEWLKNDLAVTGVYTPKIVVTHIPLYTLRGMMFYGSMTAAGTGLLIENANALRRLFENNNVKMVLQGHVHICEQMEYNGIQYISSGAVSGAKWRGPLRKSPEGFGVISCTKDETKYEYVESGWNANQR
jgi:predicted phosphodiesterase